MKTLNVITRMTLACKPESNVSARLGTHINGFAQITNIMAGYAITIRFLSAICHRPRARLALKRLNVRNFADYRTKVRPSGRADERQGVVV